MKIEEQNLNEPQKPQLNIGAVISRYLCDECGWIGTRAEMKNEQDIDYNQDCCPKCNNVMFDDGHGYVYCEKV
jgi:DNA polymerase III alpha subunit (gram-positive type)